MNSFWDPLFIRGLFPVMYIDPGTGSMLFTILIGLLGTAGYLFRNLFVKLRFRLSGGKKEKDLESESIPYVIFADSKRYWNTFEPICDELERRREPITYMTASPDDPALKKEYEYVDCRFIGEGNHAFAKLNFLKADIFLSTTPGLDVYQWKRSKGVKWYVHVLHMPTDPSSYRMFGLDYYDAVLLSGEYQVEQIRKLEKLRNLPEKELKLVGLPYMDSLYKRNQAEIAGHPRTILVAPSWGESSLLNRFGSELIQILIATGYRIIIRPHPQSFISEKAMIDGLMTKFSEAANLEWNRDNDNFEVLRQSDLMISDFSGVMFDYALVFQGPVIYVDTKFDKGPYDAWWLEEEMWTFQILPKIGKQLNEDNMHDLKQIIEEMLDGVQYQKGIEEAKQESWAHIGESAKMISDYLILKRSELQENA